MLTHPTLETLRRLRLNGMADAYAEQMLLHENGVVKIDKDFPFAQAALIGCGVTTGVGAALKTAKVTPGSTVAVFGAGGVGLSAIQGARIAGARQIIAVDMVEHKLQTARDLGATHSVDASLGDPVEQIREMTGGQGVDFAFEAIGDWQLLQFKRDPESGGRIMRYGLWRFTRHPNYFGEATLWWGIFLIALGAPLGWLALISPLLIDFLLLKVSGIPMLEERYVGNSEFAVYKQRTNAFFPWFPKG